MAVAGVAPRLYYTIRRDGAKNEEDKIEITLVLLTQF